VSALVVVVVGLSVVVNRVGKVEPAKAVMQVLARQGVPVVS
jgi:hypothetical protein